MTHKDHAKHQKEHAQRLKDSGGRYINVMLQRALYDKIKRIADKRGCSITAATRQLIEEAKE